MGEFNKPVNSNASIRAIEVKIHLWLKANREGYNAARWAVPIENHGKKGEFSLSLPPEANQILSTNELEGITTKLPDSWYDKHEGEI